MKLQLISFSLCPFVHRATMMLREKGVPFETTYIDLRNKPEWFLKISPRGKVPVLVADETTIFESAVIMEFLDETHAPRMVPENPFERARQRAWLEPANDLFMAHYEMTRAKTKEEHDEAAEELAGVVQRYEETIAGPYFAGAELGIVDVAIAPVFYRMKLAEARTRVRFFAGAPKVDAWARLLSERESVKLGVSADFAEQYLASLRDRDGYLWRTFS